MIRFLMCVAMLTASPFSVAQSPSNPPPPMPGPTAMAMSFMQLGGEADVFEVTSSQIALKRASAPAVRQFATMLVDHHTMTTNVMLAAAKAAGLVAPPAVLGQAKREMIDALLAASPAEFDRLYLSQQIPAHEQALELHRFYAASGDTPALKTAATGAVPIVEKHLAEARRLAGG